MPNHTSKLSKALRKVGLPLRLQTRHGTAVISMANEDGFYTVSGGDKPPELNAILDNALCMAAERLAALRPPPPPDPGDFE